MRNLFVLIFFSSNFFLFAQKQISLHPQVKVYYLTTFLMDTTDLQSLKNEFQVCLLDTVSKRQVFMPEGEFNRDSLLITNGNMLNFMQDPGKYRSVIPFTVYVDEKEKKTIVLSKIYNKQIL